MKAISEKKTDPLSKKSPFLIVYLFFVFLIKFLCKIKYQEQKKWIAKPWLSYALSRDNMQDKTLGGGGTTTTYCRAWGPSTEKKQMAQFSVVNIKKQWGRFFNGKWFFNFFRQNCDSWFDKTLIKLCCKRWFVKL